ncbi:MAG: TetR family transcriptional regulator [Alphaproteobacteria bacterium]|nr:TetR family transcriptional regulator [Alphaproteobacteria bacterium]
MVDRASTDVRRAQIVDAFRTVLVDVGYDAATIARIARAAGLTPGLVHYHFAHKAEILGALVDGIVTGLRARVDHALAAASTPVDRVDALADALLAVDPAAADLSTPSAWAAIGAEATRRDDVRAVYARWIVALRDTFADALRDAGDPDPAAGAVVATALVEGLYGLAAAAPGVVVPGSAAGLLRGVLRARLPAGGAR